MDGLKISCPVDVSLPAKLMGSEGCGGGVRVSSNKADNNCEKARVSIGVNSSIERCSSASINKKGLLISLHFDFKFHLGILKLFFFTLSTVYSCRSKCVFLFRVW